MFSLPQHHQNFIYGSGVTNILGDSGSVLLLQYSLIVFKLALVSSAEQTIQSLWASALEKRSVFEKDFQLVLEMIGQKIEVNDVFLLQKF